MDDFERSMHARVGTTLGRYTLTGMLGIGGMACVYRGRHRNGNLVAIKVLHRELTALGDIRARFQAEGLRANRVNHRGAVRVLDEDVTEDGTVYMVMELLEGESVEQYAIGKGGLLSPKEAARIGAQLLEVLCAAHSVGIVHRDIKPENLFLVAEDRSLKVLDFGIARLTDGPTSAMTRSGRLMGTPVYMAPEQARGKTSEINAQTDVWAVGATLFRLITGRFVYECETPELTIIASATQSPPKIASIVPELSPALAAIIDRALVPAQTERWPNAEAVLAALRRVDDLSDAPLVPRTSALPRTLDMTDAAPLDARSPIAASVDEKVVLPPAAAGGVLHNSSPPRHGALADTHCHDSGTDFAPPLPDALAIAPLRGRTELVPSDVHPPVTTTMGVSSSAIPVEVGRSARGSTTKRWATVVALGALALGVGVVTVRCGPPAPAASSPSTSGTIPPSVPASGLDAAVTAPIPTPVSSPSSSSTATPPTPMRKPTPVPTPRASDAPTLHCNPPYNVLPNGQKVWKHGC